MGIGKGGMEGRRLWFYGRYALCYYRFIISSLSDALAKQSTPDVEFYVWSIILLSLKFGKIVSWIP